MLFEEHNSDGIELSVFGFQKAKNAKREEIGGLRAGIDQLLRTIKKRAIEKATAKEKRCMLRNRQKRNRCSFDAKNKQIHYWLSFFDENGYNMNMEFTWSLCGKWFHVSPAGFESSGPMARYNYAWSNPQYPGGNNIILPYYGDVGDFTAPNFGRDKGVHNVRKYCNKCFVGYCGRDVEFVKELYTGSFNDFDRLAQPVKYTDPKELYDKFDDNGFMK